MLVLLPFAITSVISDIFEPQGNQVHELTSSSVPQPSHTRLHLDIISIDEWAHTVTIRVSGHHLCPVPCDHSDRVVFVSIPPGNQDGEGLPPSESVTFPNAPTEVSKEIKLQVSGQPIRYPFDSFKLTLGFILQEVPTGSSVRAVEPAQQGHLFLSLQTQAPRLVMSDPVAVNPAGVFTDGALYQYQSIDTVTFTRPLYLKVLTVLLVLLVTAAAAYAVFMRPLDQLVINSGALVLGVWGIRSILLGTSVPGITSVDLALSVVILFLLAAITVRAMLYLHRRSGMRAPTTMLRRHAREPHPPAPSPPLNAGHAGEGELPPR